MRAKIKKMAKKRIGTWNRKVGRSADYDIINNSVCGIIHVGTLKINGLFKQRRPAV